MKIFQNACQLVPGYVSELSRFIRPEDSYKEALDKFIDDKYGINHMLGPVIKQSDEIFYTNLNCKLLQHKWSKNKDSYLLNLKKIAYHQMEEHKSEIFYDLNPFIDSKNFLKKMPGSVKYKILWRAAPLFGDLSSYDLIVNNFPQLLKGFQSRGLKTSYFAPSFYKSISNDQLLKDREIDILFVGSFSRFHKARSILLDTVISNFSHLNIHIHLEKTRLVKLCEMPFFNVIPYIKNFTRPTTLSCYDRGGIYGNNLYSKIQNSKVVLNMGADFSISDRGNLRSFEALNCGALLLTDDGNYPDGFVHNETMLIYKNLNDLSRILNSIFCDLDAYEHLRQNGNKMMARMYGSEDNFKKFMNLI
jgi:hypothetical protein